MILISLPAYNEEQSLEPLLNDIGNVMNELNIDYKILILDDGSTDNTLKILNSFSKKLPLIIKKHNVNQGLGETLNDLFKESARITNDEDIIITFDADNTHKPKHIPLMLPHFKEGYNPEVIEFLGTWDIVTSPLYHPYRMAETVRWKFLRLKSKFVKPRF